MNSKRKRFSGCRIVQRKKTKESDFVELIFCRDMIDKASLNLMQKEIQ